MSDVLKRLRDPKNDWVLSPNAKQLLLDVDAEIVDLRAAIQKMVSVAEEQQKQNVELAENLVSQRSAMKHRAVVSQMGMLLGELRKIARAALGEGK